MADPISPSTPQSPEEILRKYIEAANKHDMETLREIFAEDVIWHLGPDTLVGIEEILGPHLFDAGANTVIIVHDITATSPDAIEFELVEKNDVLGALGIPELHHFVRIEFADGKITRMTPTRPPAEQESFVKGVVAFMQWLKDYHPEGYDTIWPGGKFNYSRPVGEEMPGLVRDWKQKTENP